jgi:hypothetical protein
MRSLAEKRHFSVVGRLYRIADLARLLLPLASGQPSPPTSSDHCINMQRVRTKHRIGGYSASFLNARANSCPSLHQWSLEISHAGNINPADFEWAFYSRLQQVA